MRRALLLPFALCLAACADNAIFELELDLPAATGTQMYAYVQSRSADAITFDGDWAGADAPEGFLLTASPSVQHVSFVTTGAAMTRRLGVRVRFCSDRVCGAISDTNAPEADFDIQRAFYRGKRTTLRVTVTPTPTPAPVTTVMKCEVAGCTTGTATSYCYADGRHFCE
jgi:hypothetical protein